MTKPVDTVDAITAKAYEAGTKVRALYDNAEGELQDLANTIQKKPLQTGLIALGAGVVLGLLLGRRA